MKWTKKLSTGNETLDEQHQFLFRQLEELENAAAEESTMLAVYALSRLNGYTREHFAAEEALMKAAGFPRFEQHVTEHAVFSAKVKMLLEKAIYHEITMEVVDLVKSWLVDHIQGSDMEYVPYLKEMAAREGKNASR